MSQLELDPDFKPNSQPLGSTYLRAIEELVRPYPSIMLRGWPTLNKILGGFRAREFTIICGGTGVGKTTLLANLSKPLLLDHVKHFVMSVETGETDYVKRVMSTFLPRDINTGDAVPVEAIEKFHATYGEYFRGDTLQLGLYEDRVPVERLKRELIYHQQVLGSKIAFVDNLNFFMEVTSAQNSIVEMDRVIHELIILAKQIDMHIVMIMHPRKTEDGRVDDIYDIKGSSTAVQEAHNVILFNRPHPDLIDDNIASPGDRELTFAKMRRRGQYVGQKLIIKCQGAQYQEGLIV